MPGSSAAHSEGRWLTGLDGLRAVAVIAVLLFHADLGAVSGGFLGVDVFFVISGFLITTLLLREHALSGRINLAAFWRRRARRLLPALFLVLIGVIVFAAIMVPDELGRLRIDVLAALAYVTNWYLLADNQSYFETIGRPSLLRHLWSLAVEEQFYLLWPIVLALALAVVRRRGAVLVTLLLAVASIAWTAVLYDPDGDPSRVYYGTDTRLFGLLIGALLAFALPARRDSEPDAASAVRRPAATAAPRTPGWLTPAAPTTDAIITVPRLRHPRWPDVLAAAGLASLVWAFLSVDEFDAFLYPWGTVAVALITATVIAGVVHPASSIGRRVLDAAPMRWIGQRSYGIYLWHWPVFVVTRPGLDLALTPAADLVVRVGVTVALAELSFRFVELPIRRGALGGLGARLRVLLRGSAWARAGALASAASLLIAVATVSGRVLAAPSAPPVPIAPIASFQGVIIVEAPSVGATPGTAATTAPDPVAGASGAGTSGGGTPDPSGGGPSGGGTAGPGDSPGPTGPPPTDQPGPTPPIATAPPTGSAGPSGGSEATPLAAGSAGASGLPSTTGRPASASAVPSGSAPPASPPSATAAPASPPPTSAPSATPPPSGTSAPATAPPILDANVFAIGDSVLLGAARELGQALGKMEVDAQVGRQMATALAILTDRRASGRLPDVVIVHLGNNGPVTGKQVQAMFDILSGVPHVVMLTVRISDDFEAHNNRLLTQAARDYPNVILVDWHAASDGRPGLFWNDGEHLRPEGAQVYASLIAAALREHGVATR